MSTRWLQIPGRVQCISGHRLHVRPLTLVLGDGERRVVEILEEATHGPLIAGASEWRVFDVRANDGCRYRLAYDLSRDRWLIKRLEEK